jgi:hypothetical protein
MRLYPRQQKKPVEEWIMTDIDKSLLDPTLLIIKMEISTLQPNNSESQVNALQR